MDSDGYIAEVGEELGEEVNSRLGEIGLKKAHPVEKCLKKKSQILDGS